MVPSSPTCNPGIFFMTSAIGRSCFCLRLFTRYVGVSPRCETCVALILISFHRLPVHHDRLSLALTVILVTGCKETHNKGIDLAYRLAPTAPDSALAIHAKLGKTEKARYALVYTIAQDKSRLDVDNNSLLRTAYTYYNNQENDSLYAKCEYYMLNNKNANKLSLLIKKDVNFLS